MVCNALREQSIINIMEVIKMKKSDLHIEWARVLDMCEGTKVRPFVCWNRKGYDRLKPARCAPAFSEDPDSYEFAVAILEGKPVFVGDKIYAKQIFGSEFDWDDPDHIRQITCEDLCVDPEDVWTWNPPKKTFMLNGEELPCATTKQGGEVMIIKVGNQECHFMFESGKDADKVMTSIYNLLIGSIK